MKTYYAQVVKGPPPAVGAMPDLTRDWREWLNVKPADVSSLPQMILHRWIRDRGGIMQGERLTVTVYWFPEDVKRTPSGMPIGCAADVFNVSLT